MNPSTLPFALRVSMEANVADATIAKNFGRSFPAFGGGFFAAQWWLARKNPETNHYKAFSIATGAAATGLGVVAARNYGVRKVAQQDSTAAAHPYLRNTVVAPR